MSTQLKLNECKCTNLGLLYNNSFKCGKIFRYSECLYFVIIDFWHIKKPRNYKYVSNYKILFISFKRKDKAHPGTTSVIQRMQIFLFWPPILSNTAHRDCWKLQLEFLLLGHTFTFTQLPVNDRANKQLEGSHS